MLVSFQWKMPTKPKRKFARNHGSCYLAPPKSASNFPGLNRGTGTRYCSRSREGRFAALSRSLCYPTGETITLVERLADRRGDD